MSSVVIDRQAERRKSLLQFALKAIVSIGLLWLLLRHIALRSVIAQIATVDWAAVVGAFFILCTATLLAALRWSVILRALGEPRSLRVTYPLSLIGLFFGQALPGGVGGDVIRVWLGRQTGLSTRVAISSILGDRLTGFMAILLIVTVELPKLTAIFPNPVILYGVLAILAAGYAGFAIVLLLDRLPQGWRRFRIFRGFAGLSLDLRVTLSSRAGLPILPLGVVIQLANVLAVFVLCEGLHLPVTLLTASLIVPVANIVQALPISIAGWGIREGFFVAAFGMVGVTAPAAIAVSVVFGLLVILGSLPGGILWLFYRIRKPLEIREFSSTNPIAGS